MRRLPVVLAAAAGLAAAPPAAAQDSVFGIRGLGFLDRSVSGKSAALGGGFALFDAESALNPASLSAWRGTAGWAVAAGSNHSFDAGSGSSSLSATRFPVVGFASAVGPRVVVAVTASDYLDRNWSVQQTDTVSPRGTPVVASDQTKSVGGVTDIRAALAYRLTGITLGVGLHALTGSTETTVNRTFPNDSAYLAFTQQLVTNYSGVGISFGALVSAAPRFVAGASVRFNGRLRASTADTAASVPLPLEVNAGAYYQPVAGVLVTGTVGYAGWSTASDALVAAGQARSRNVWSVGFGVEAAMLRIGGNLAPLRVGYRWRQLPFPIGGSPAIEGSPLSEHALAGGLGFDTAGGRATVDLGIESGSRTAGALSETFTTAYLGLTIRP
jgi:hypothetical protein